MADAPALSDVERARAAIADVIRHTPVLPSATLSERCGTEVVLKAESLQRTGSFKVRGALAELHALGDACARGVVTGSAGNHGQALAAAAQARGVPCEVYMPAGAAVAKVEGALALGARVRLTGHSVEDALGEAIEEAEREGVAFVHPFDDPDVIAGQGTLGLELLEDVPRLDRVVVPVGGGGLASGVALALKETRPEVRVVGVQVETIAAAAASLAAGRPVSVEPALTVADGIAVKRPGALTLELMRRRLDGLVTVPEDDVAEAMVALLEKAKLVVEGAGAVGVAALLGGRVDEVAPPGDGVTVAVLSGGNVDAGLLASVARRHETQAGRRLALLTRLPDHPGALARLLTLVGEAGANLVGAEHVREGLELHVRESAVHLVLETRGREHAAAVLGTIRDAGYDVRDLR